MCDLSEQDKNLSYEEWVDGYICALSAGGVVGRPPQCLKEAVKAIEHLVEIGVAEPVIVDDNNILSQTVYGPAAKWLNFKRRYIWGVDVAPNKPEDTRVSTKHSRQVAHLRRAV